jgi:hypothetical protein
VAERRPWAAVDSPVAEAVVAVAAGMVVDPQVVTESSAD